MLKQVTKEEKLWNKSDIAVPDRLKKICYLLIIKTFLHIKLPHLSSSWYQCHVISEMCDLGELSYDILIILFKLLFYEVLLLQCICFVKTVKAIWCFEK